MVWLMFSSPDCGGCRHLRRVLREVRRHRPRGRVFEVDARRDLALTNAFGVLNLPTVFRFFPGQFPCERQAPAQTARLIEAANAAQRRPAEEVP